ncbi:hypothetical protein TNCV_1703211 [Trichonephila clavipes]|nr:hypothetical protein TNCV_1703211 [Trichonephila clavipes]
MRRYVPSLGQELRNFHATCHARSHRGDIVDDYLESEGIAYTGLRSYGPSHLPLFTQWHKALRIAWDRQHPRWILKWKNDIWYEESRFQLYRVHGRIRVRRKPNEYMDPSCL